jgi:two-component system CheB/CheR fusion protein
MLPRLFDPFVQGNMSLARERGGLGLGLVLAKRFTELHGGNITISSKGTGKGTEVVVRFPLTAGPTIPPESARAVSGGPLRILIIEDDSDVAESLKELLGLRGHVVEVATEGLRGVELASRTSPEVVLCDIGLPDIDGYAAAREIRARARGAYLVALSGYAQSDDVMQARHAGFDAHLAKPASVEQLEKLLAEISNAAK